MRNIKIFWLTVFLCISIYTFGQSKPNILVTKSNNAFNVTLKLDYSSLNGIIIQGFYFAEGSKSNFNIAYNENELKRLKNKAINLHQLEANTDYALYTITTVNVNGDRKQHPSTKVNMPTGYSNSGKL